MVPKFFVQKRDISALRPGQSGLAIPLITGRARIAASAVRAAFFAPLVGGLDFTLTGIYTNRPRRIIHSERSNLGPSRFELAAARP